MTLEKIVALSGKIVAATVVLVVGGIVGAYWWANTPPARPRGVSSDAVWLWAPYVGLPGPRRGDWLSCSVDADWNKCDCRMSDIHGNVLYQGAFLPLEAGSIPHREVDIEIDETREQAVFIGDALVPLVHLKGGGVLIPAAKFEEGKKLLNSFAPSR
jgi:hypothetical protein